MDPMKTFRHVADKKLVLESDLIVCPSEEWDESDKAMEPEWSVLRVGFEVFALRLRGIPRMLGRVATGAQDVSQPPID
jgi:hypothetical protein